MGFFFFQEVDLLFQNFPQISSTSDVRKLYCQSFEDLLPFENVEPTDDNINSYVHPIIS